MEISKFNLSFKTSGFKLRPIPAAQSDSDSEADEIARTNFARVQREVNLQDNSDKQAPITNQDDTPEFLEEKVITRSQTRLIDIVTAMEDAKEGIPDLVPVDNEEGISMHAKAR